MLNYSIKMPMRYYQGEGIIENLKEYTKHLGNSCLLVITRSGWSRYKAPLVRGLLGNTMFIYEVDNPPDDTRFNYDSVDFVLGVGGGYAIDYAKKLADVINKPYVIVPTVLSSDAASNSIAVPKQYVDRDTMIRRCNRNPDVVVADTRILVESPIEYAIAGLCDALSTSHEALSAYNTTGYTMTHATIPPFMIPMLSNLRVRLHRFGFDAIMEGMTNKKVTESFDQLVSMILYESSILSENCGIGIAHAFSLAYDEVCPRNNIPHGIKVSFGLLLHLTVVENSLEFDKVFHLIKSLGVIDSLGLSNNNNLDYNKLMEISKSISENKLTKNAVGKEMTPVEIYGYLINTHAKIKANSNK